MTIQYFSRILWKRSLRKTITSPVVLIWAILLVAMVVAVLVGIESGPGGSIILFGKPAPDFDMFARATIQLVLRLPLAFFLPIVAAFLSVELLQHSTVHYVVTAPIRRRAIISSTWMGSAAAYMAVVFGFALLLGVVFWVKGLGMIGVVLAGAVVGLVAAAIHAFVLLCTLASGNAGLGVAAGVVWAGMLGPMLGEGPSSSVATSALLFVLPPVSELSRHLDGLLVADPEMPWLLVVRACTASIAAIAVAVWVYGRKEF